jgi:hypothetical protein
MRILAPAVVLAVLLTAGCGRPIDLKQVLQVTDVSGGYHDDGIVEGKNKLTPSISFRIKKSIDDDIRPLSLNVVFKKLPPAGVAVPPGSPAEQDWEDSFVQSVPFQANQTALLTIQIKTGYTGDPPQSRADILKHSQFQDFRVHIFAKHSASQWVEIATYDIPRQVLAQ